MNTCLVCNTELTRKQTKYCSKSCSCKGTQSWKTKQRTEFSQCRVCGVMHTRRNTPWCSTACKETEYKEKVLLLFGNPTVRRDVLKKHGLRLSIFKNECSICHISKWQGQPAPLQLDHINGVSTDNHVDNLRVLCANCHAQTDTYAGRNKKKKQRMRLSDNG